MGDLKPLGSEKLQGMDKIQRILEIAKFNEKTPVSVNETSKTEYTLQLADGNTYQIVREKSGYIIKQSISESETDYIAPLQDRKYYSSYSQALKRLNLMAKEMNELYGNEGGISLFSEQKKFVLKTPQKKSPTPTDEVENIPAPPPPPPAPSPSDAAPSPEGDMAPPPPSDESGMDSPSMDDMPSEEPSSDMDTTDTGVDKEMDEQVTWKTIQKLTGKLGQKLRKYSSSEENELTSNDIKYVINSVLSAFDLSILDEEDREEIMSKFDMESSEEGMESPDMEEPDMESPEDVDTEGPENFPAPEGEMEEGLDDIGHIRSIADEMFKESKVENILMKYFKVDEKEKQFIKEMRESRETENKKRLNFMSKEISRLSESVEQESKAKKFLSENKSAKLIGKTNKKNLVFQIGQREFKITPKGNFQ